MIGRLCKRSDALSRPVLMGRGLDVVFAYPGHGAVFKPHREWWGARADRPDHPGGFATFGGDSEGDTPLPIPNRAVKPLSADGTWCASAWESRSPPVFVRSRPSGRLLTFAARSTGFARAAGTASNQPVRHPARMGAQALEPSNPAEEALEASKPTERRASNPTNPRRLRRAS